MGSLVNSLFNPGAHINLGNSMRFIPEPKSSKGLTLEGALGTFSDVARGVFSKAAGAAGFGDLSPEYTALIQQQIEVQKQMQLMTFVSNVEKSKHETKMAAVRNIRVG